VIKIKSLRKGRKERSKGEGSYSWYDKGQVIPSSMVECRYKTERGCLVVFSKSLGVDTHVFAFESFRYSARTISNVEGHSKLPSE
jgi:hypothetical protein